MVQSTTCSLLQDMYANYDNLQLICLLFTDYYALMCSVKCVQRGWTQGQFCVNPVLLQVMRWWHTVHERIGTARCDAVGIVEISFTNTQVSPTDCIDDRIKVYHGTSLESAWKILDHGFIQKQVSDTQFPSLAFP